MDKTPLRVQRPVADKDRRDQILSKLKTIEHY